MDIFRLSASLWQLRVLADVGMRLDLRELFCRSNLTGRVTAACGWRRPSWWK